MKTEKQKMLSGELYNASDKKLTEERLNTRLLLKKINDLAETEEETKNRLLEKLIPKKGKKLFIQTPFYCDYGTNIELGEDVYFCLLYTSDAADE